MDINIDGIGDAAVAPNPTHRAAAASSTENETCGEAEPLPTEHISCSSIMAGVLRGKKIAAMEKSLASKGEQDCNAGPLAEQIKGFRAAEGMMWAKYKRLIHSEQCVLANRVLDLPGSVVNAVQICETAGTRGEEAWKGKSWKDLTSALVWFFSVDEQPAFEPEVASHAMATCEGEMVESDSKFRFAQIVDTVCHNELLKVVSDPANKSVLEDGMDAVLDVLEEYDIWRISNASRQPPDRLKLWDSISEALGMIARGWLKHCNASPNWRGATKDHALYVNPQFLRATQAAANMGTLSSRARAIMPTTKSLSSLGSRTQGDHLQTACGERTGGVAQ